MSTDEPGEYVPQPGDVVVFDRPPDGGGGQRSFRVASHDAGTGLTRFDGLAESLSAQQLAELGAKKAIKVEAGQQLKANWAGAARRLVAEGAGSRSKIQQVCRPHVAGGGHVMRTADDQAALALAQQAADDIGEPIILARVRSGELLIGSQPAFEAVAEAYGAQTILVVQPQSPGTSGWLTARQARERISGQQARDALSAALSSATDMSEEARSATVNEVIYRLTGLLSFDDGDPGVLPLPPGWRYHEELMPEAAEVLARIRSEEGFSHPPGLSPLTAEPAARSTWPI
jgi:hypothetical protein